MTHVPDTSSYPGFQILHDDPLVFIHFMQLEEAQLRTVRIIIFLVGYEAPFISEFI